MPNPYSWITLATAQQQLAQRLSDPNMEFWRPDELTIYLQQALRMWNCLTWFWKQDFAFNNGSQTNVWSSLDTLVGSPRLRTVTDTYCYTEMQYMLLEPPSGGVWTGTSQFSIADMAQALQRRRDEIIQVADCNKSVDSSIPLTPGTTRTILADSVIEVSRVRYLKETSNVGFGQGQFGQGGFGGFNAIPITLYRDDTIAQEFYESPLYQQDAGTPNTFMVSSQPPLAFDVDIPPATPGLYEAIILSRGTPLSPPSDTVLGIPDDFAWVAEWGALADLLGKDSEATDRERADYAMKRYLDGVNLMLKSPWIMLGKVNGVAVTIDSLFSADRYSPEWDSDPSGFGPFIVVAGMDLLAAPTATSTGVTVLGNMPVPVAGGDFLQIPPSDLDVIMDLAQARASFKLGGEEWKAALELEQRALLACAAENSRLRSLGAFSDIFLQRGQVQDRDQERYNSNIRNQGKQ